MNKIEIFTPRFFKINNMISIPIQINDFAVRKYLFCKSHVCWAPSTDMFKYMHVENFFSHFSGSIDSLKTIPQQNGIDVYNNLKEFEHKMYSAQFMTLAVQSKGRLLLKWTIKLNYTFTYTGKYMYMYVKNCVYFR